VTATFWALAPAAAFACPICFQLDDANTVAGVRAGVGVLLGVTSVVLVGAVVFFGRMARRQ